MNTQRFLIFTLLTSLMIASFSGLPHASAAPPQYPIQLTAPLTATVTLPADASTDWWTAAQEDIRRSEYHVTWQEQTYLDDVSAAYQAPNRAHNLRTYFTDEGIRIIPRTPPQLSSEGESQGGVPIWNLGLTLTGYGYEGNIQPLGKLARTVVNDNRFEYYHQPEIEDSKFEIIEWYINGERGLEQGFTITAPPTRAATPPTAPLVLELTLTGNLISHLTNDGQAIELTTPDSELVLRYTAPQATDATGRQLVAQLALRDSAQPQQSPLAILIDDANAVYPITLASLNITNLSTTPNWIVEGDQDSAYFGNSVSTAGDVNGDGYSDVIIGAPNYDAGQTDEGRAYGYYGSATGLSATADWIVDGNQSEAYFGRSVSIAGDVNGDGYVDVIIGASGSAYIYYGSSAGLLWTASWTVNAGGNFGNSVSTAGDVNGDGYADVIVGASSYDGDQTDAGRAYVYYGAGTGLNTTADWTAEGDQDYANFGYSVSTAGDVNGDGYADVIVGMPSYDSDQTDAGRVFVYHGAAGGLNSTPDWMAESNQDYAKFGTSVSTAGDVNGDGYADVIVGAPRYDGDQTDAGRAYVYHGSVTGLSATANWLVASDQASAHFGHSVSTAGDVNGDGYSDIIVGALYYDAGQTDEGRAYVYHGSATGLSVTANWIVESNQETADFGHSIGTAGDVNGDGYADIIVGAYRYDNGETDEGGAFVYHGSPAGLSATRNWMAEGEQDYAELGTSVSTAGDVNGDGYADVIVGAPGYDGGQTDEGRAYIYHGTMSGLNTTADWNAESDLAGAHFGHSVDTAGDVNGDGYSDVIVGAYGADKAYVYHGDPTGLSTGAADWTAQSDRTGAYFGYSVGAAGDVNGDGYADIIVGAHLYDNSGTDEGRVFVYHGAATGLSASTDWTVEGDQDSGYLGWSVSTAGDVNSDGYSDIIVGARSQVTAEIDAGQAYVYHGATAGLGTLPDWVGDGGQASANFGYAVSAAGDVNGDGYSDVIIGAPHYDNGETDKGRVCVYYGSSGGLATGSADWTAEGNQKEAQFGFAVSVAGDVNGDGYADVIVGAPGYDETGLADRGAAFVYYGSATGLSATHVWMVTSIQINAQLGTAVSAAGDVNGDGYADVIVGVPYYDNGQMDEGQAYTYYGNDGGGTPLTLGQFRTDGSAPIAPLGLSDSTSAVQLRMTGRIPLDREKVKLQWQIAPLGIPFTATTGVVAGESSTWTDVLTTSVLITQNVTGLTSATPYHWRARLLYRSENRLGLSAGRWVHVPWNSWTEQDFRTADEPIAGLVVVNNSPTPAGQATTLTATIAAGSNVAYTWDLGGGDFASGSVVTHTYPPGTHTAVVTASNSVSTRTATTTITVEQALATPLAINDSPTALGQTTTLTVTVMAEGGGTLVLPGNVTYTWAFGDGHTGSGAVTTHTYPLGVYTAIVTASNLVSVVTATTAVTVDAPIAGLVVVNNSPTLADQATTLTATIAAGSNVAYTWDLGGGDFASGSVVTHTYPLGVHTTLVTASNSVSTVTATTTVTVADAPIAGLVAINDSPTTAGLTTTLMATITAGSNVTYTWAFGDGENGSGALVAHVYPAAAIYTAVVTASNSVNALTATTTVSIPVIYLPLIMRGWPPIPATPVLNTISNLDDGGCYSVSWGSVDVARSYTLEEFTNADFTTPTIVYTGAETLYAVSHKPVGTYYYRVKASNSWGDSGWSNVEKVVVRPLDTPELSPINNSDGASNYKVSWNTVSGAISYTLKEDDNAAFSSPETPYTGTSTSWNARDKTSGTYYYRVKASNSERDSGWSNVQPVTVTWAELMVNGGFETGPSALPWVQYSNSDSELIDGSGARTGNWGVYMGGLIDATDQIYQVVTITINAPALQLSYWRWIRTADSSTIEYDKMRCKVWDIEGQVLDCGAYSNVDQSPDWVHEIYDMSAFLGQTIKLGFETSNDNLYPTQFFIDDVSLRVTANTTVQADAVEIVLLNNRWRLADLAKIALPGERTRLPSRLELEPQ